MVINNNYESPAIPSTTKLSLVKVPVLSKQHMSILPANGILNGSVQKTKSLLRASKDELTAKESSIGNSGGTTDVRISVHSKNNLYRFLLGFSVPIIILVRAQSVSKISTNF